MHVKVIAAGIGKGFQTVYREIRRNSKPDGSYQPWYAHNQAGLRRRRPKCHRIVEGSQLRAVINDQLAVKWSPQQITRYLTRAFPDDPTMQACPEAIYQALFAGRLGPQHGKLRTGRCRRKRHRRGVANPSKIKNMRPVAQRPPQALARTEAGHWEGDLIIGRHMHSAIATLVERVTRYTILVELRHGYKAPQLRDALLRSFSSMPAVIRKTLTWDQGREMTLHEEFSLRSGVDVYFCDPHSPWQRPTNENTNGLLRQYFPKHTDLSTYRQPDLDQVARELNQRPRLVLGDRTPQHVLTSFLGKTDAAMFATIG